MNYQITLFKQTGFNSINIPGSQALIDSCPQITLSSDDAQCDILQAKGLTTLPLRVSYDDAKLVDYMRLSNATEKVYYSVRVIPELSSPDVTHFKLTYDPINSNVSNVSQIKFLDGVFERHHVSTDNLFEYTEDDPMMVPSEPLEIVMDDAIGDTPSTTGTFNDSVVIEASFDVHELGTATPAATAYTTTNSENVIVPDIPKLPSVGYAEMYDPEIATDALTQNPSVCYYDGENTDIQQGIARARALGIESGILNQYILPGFYGTAMTSQSADEKTLKGLHGNVVLDAVGMQWQYGTGIHNKRVYAGKANSYGLICTASGNSVEFLPEDIHTSGALSLIPSVAWTADPRPNGKPYFRYTNYKGSSTNFWMNCISGLPWQNAPLVYTSKSGSEIDTVRYQTSLSMMELNTQLQTRQMKYNAVSQGISQLGGLEVDTRQNYISGFNGNPNLIQSQGVYNQMNAAGLSRTSQIAGHNMGVQAQLISNGMNAVVGQAAGMVSDYGTLKNLQDSLFAQEAQEAQEFYISQRVVTPQINFPRSESLRDFKGNCCVPYRYRYSNKDLAKMDKILTMYGYADHQIAPGNEAFLTNRPVFNYCKIAGASIGGTLPQWEREAIAMVFSVGVRIWHTLPNQAYYTDGSNDLT